MKQQIFHICLTSILLFLICLPLSIAQEDHELDDIVYDASAMQLTLVVDSSFELIPQSSSYRIDSVQADVMRFPYPSAYQDIISLETQPPLSTQENNTLHFKWIKPQTTAFDFTVRSTVETKKEYAKVRNINSLPISFPEEFRIYAQPSTTIDSDHPTITERAKLLREKHSTLYEYAIASADWVHTSIQYNLSTMTAEASQQASWVLKNRKGVCDEITSLFIALMRAQGIPARFISGPAYSNVIGDWESHGWAEVYFPEQGWVPFDVTFGQFGYVDAGHIALQRQVDPSEFSITYEWVGRNVKFKDLGSDVDTIVHSYALDFDRPYNVSLRPVYDTVGFGSFNQVEYKVTNTKDYYVTFAAHISDTQYVDLISERRKLITLAPFETRYYYWTVQVNEALDPSFAYSFPLVVRASHGPESKSSFKAGHTSPTYQQESFTQLQKEATQRFERSDDVLFLCTPDQSTISVGQKQQFSCTLENKDEEVLSDISICFKETCREVSSLPADQETTVSFEESYSEPKQYVESISVSGTDLYKSAESTITVLDTPQLNIENIVLPSEVTYGEFFEMHFEITKDSFASASNATLLVFVNKVPVEWNLGDITKTRDLSVTLDTKELSPGGNNIDIVVLYESAWDEQFTETAQDELVLREPVDIQNVELFFNSIERWFKLLFLKKHDVYFDTA